VALEVLGNNVSIFAGGQRGRLSRRITVWIAAYALVLQSIIAPLIASPFNPHSIDENPLFELCLVGKSALSPATSGVPAGTDDHDNHCKLCINGGLAFIVAPSTEVGWAVRPIGASIRWAVIDNPVPDAAGFIGKQARGPPLLT
jgi:hypothetical protein